MVSQGPDWSNIRVVAKPGGLLRVLPYKLKCNSCEGAMTGGGGILLCPYWWEWGERFCWEGEETRGGELHEVQIGCGWLVFAAKARSCVQLSACAKPLPCLPFPPATHVTTSSKLMETLEEKGLGNNPREVPCIFSKRSAMHKGVLSLVEEVHEDGSMAVQVSGQKAAVLPLIMPVCCLCCL